ncbi:hypothetical protein PMAYCL1PPCAC_15349, partial [Pristionchus mayeri]
IEMHSTSVLLLALSVLVVSIAVAETSDRQSAFAFADRRGNVGKFAYHRFAKRSSPDEAEKFAFAFAKRSPSEDVVEQVVERFARRFAREVMQEANARGFAFA